MRADEGNGLQVWALRLLSAGLVPCRVERTCLTVPPLNGHLLAYLSGPGRRVRVRRSLSRMWGWENPRPLFGAVSLPVHQVLVAATPPADVEDFLDGVCWRTFNHRLGRQVRLHHKLNPGEVEGGVDIH